MNSSLIHTLFGPLDSRYCMYFYIVMILFFISFAFAVLYEIYFIAKNSKNITSTKIYMAIVLIFNTFLAYFVNRLFYTMCSKSLI